jgi:outer membrane protein TolC
MLKVLLAALLFLEGWIPVSAAPSRGLTLNQAVQEALEANLNLQAEGKTLKARTRDKDFRFQKLFPTVTAGAGFLNYNDLTAQQRLAGFSGTNPILLPTSALNFGMVLNTQLTLSLGTFANMDQTLSDWEAGRVSYEITKQRLVGDVKKTFYRILALQETRKLLQDQVDNAEARYRQVDAAYQNGSSPELNLLQADIARENLRNDLRSLDATFKQVSYGFCLLLGRPPSEDLSLEGKIEPKSPGVPLNAEALADKYLPGRLDLVQARVQRRALDVQVSQVASQAVPQLVVGYSADPSLNNPMDQNLTDSGKWHQPTGSWNLQLQWKLDSFLPGSTFWTVLADLDDVKIAADLNQKRTREAAFSEVLNLTNQVEKSTKAMVSLQKIADSAARAAVLAQKAFTAGVKDLLEVQDADLQSEAAQLSLLNEKLTLNNSLIDLEVALNTPQEKIDELQ